MIKASKRVRPGEKCGKRTSGCQTRVLSVDVSIPMTPKTCLVPLPVRFNLVFYKLSMVFEKPFDNPFFLARFFHGECSFPCDGRIHGILDPLFELESIQICEGRT